MEIKNVVLPIDPESKGSKANSMAAKIIKALLKSNPGIRVYPISVVDLSEYGTLDTITQKDMTYLKKKAMDGAKAILKKAGLNTVTPEVELIKKRSLKNHVEAVLKYSRKKKADVIVIGSRNKKGLASFFVGSFAETLMFTSKIPLLVVNPDMKAVSNINNILFSTMLNDDSKKDFNKIVKFANQNKTSITLFNYFGLGKGGKNQPPFIRNLLATKQKIADELVKAGEKAGIKTKVDMKLTEADVEKAILDSATKNKCQMIVIKGKEDKLHSFLIGSTTRNILRYSKIPVLVLH